MAQPPQYPQQPQQPEQPAQYPPQQPQQPPQYPPQPPQYPPQPPQYPGWRPDAATAPQWEQPLPYPGSLPPTPPPRKSALRWIIPVVAVFGLVMVLAVVGGLVVYSNSGDKTDNKTGDAKRPGAVTGNKLPTVERPGYKDLAESVADPDPLAEKLDTPVVSHANTPVIAACSLLTIADIKRSGALVRPHVIPGSYKRSYFDNQGTGPVESGSKYTLPTSPANSCTYNLLQNTLTTIDVYQESYVDPQGMTEEVKRYEEQPAIKSVSVRRKKSPTIESNKVRATYALRLDKTLAVFTVWLATGGGNDDAVRQKMLEAVAANLEKQTTSPTGNPVITYNSPAFSAKAVNACEASKPEDYQTVFKVAPAPFVEEELATAVGRLDYSIGTGIKDSTEYAYVDTLCRRFTGEDSITERNAVRFQVRSYESAQPTVYDMQIAKGIDGGQPMSRPIGDEAYYVTIDYARAKGALVVRKGRFVVTLTLTDLKNKSTDPAAQAQRLAPVAEQLIARLGS